MATALERCHVIRTYGTADFSFYDALDEIFSSMKASWPNASFKDFSVSMAPVPEEAAFRVDLTFQAVHQ